MLRAARAASIMLVLLLALPSVAQAFVLPGPYVIARCQEQVTRLGGQRLEVEIEEAGDLYRETWTLDRRGRLTFTADRPRIGLEALRRIFGGDLPGLLRELQVDVMRTALSRLDGRVVITVGALWRELELPQLWVDQQTFLPARLQVGGRDLLLREYGSPVTLGRFPGVIQVQEGGRLLWQARVIRIEPGP